jgi:NadR type nicotinamide-nucleotide adenylyltransferase
MKRIVLTGAESTGKSTLARALAEHYQEPWTGEYVRKYVDELDRELNASDLEPIARGQFGQEDLGLGKASRLVLHDTNILSSIIYASYYFDTAIDWVDKAFRERDYTLYLLCMPDIPWEADSGQRESPSARNTLHKLFKQSLIELHLPFVEIHGTEAERIAQAVQAIDAVK